MGPYWVIHSASLYSEESLTGVMGGAYHVMEGIGFAARVQVKECVGCQTHEMRYPQTCLAEPTRDTCEPSTPRLLGSVLVHLPFGPTS